MNTNIIMYEKNPIKFVKLNNYDKIYSNTSQNTPTNTPTKTPTNNNSLINKYTSDDHLTKEMCIQSGCAVVCYTARGK